MPFEDFTDEIPIRSYKAATDGNVIVERNQILGSDGGGNFMLITGNLKADSVILYGCITLEVRGSIEAKNGVLTMYGDDGGYLTVMCDVDTKFLLNGFYFNLDIYGDTQGITIDYQL